MEPKLLRGSSLVHRVAFDRKNQVKDFVQLSLKRNRGWPWPEDSWGLDSMFGETGWCHSCGTPLHEQSGPLTLQTGGQSPVHGAWIPNWRFDAICLEESIADRVSAEFRLDLRPIAWRRKVIGAAIQIVTPTVGPAWFDPDQLRERAIARHGSAGAECSKCRIWRWLPLPFELLPPVRSDASWERYDILASPEWFGDGKKSFREILVRRSLAGVIAAASPKDFKIQEISGVTSQ
jgi:hypothetical protein